MLYQIFEAVATHRLLMNAVSLKNQSMSSSDPSSPSIVMHNNTRQSELSSAADSNIVETLRSVLICESFCADFVTRMFEHANSTRLKESVWDVTLLVF